MRPITMVYGLFISACILSGSVHATELWETDPQGDADNDGVNNFLEYAFATDPNKADAKDSVPEITQDGSHFQFNFRNKRPNVLYNIEYSSDLGQWDPWPVAPEIRSLTEMPVKLDSASLNGAPALFFRIKAEAEVEPSVTYTDSLGNTSSGPGSNLTHRANLLVRAFSPGLDDPLDTAGTALFAQIDPTAPSSDTTSYKPLDDRWGINVKTPLEDFDRTKNLAYLRLAIHRADNLICLINDPASGRTVASTGIKEPIWPPTDTNDPLTGDVTRVAHLSTGASGNQMQRLANYIFSHPALHTLTAPAPLEPTQIPSHIQVGTTMLDRAMVYHNAILDMCDFFVREGSYWEFDTTDPDNIHGWWFNNDLDGDDLVDLQAAKTAYPNGITFSGQAFYDLDVGGRPVNRAVILNGMFAETVQGLYLLDKMNGTSANRSTIEQYNNIIRRCNNTFRSFSIEFDEGPLLGVNRAFMYTPDAYRLVRFLEYQIGWYVEDATHLMMDMGGMATCQAISDLHPEDASFDYFPLYDLKALTGTMFSRFFDLKANIVCGTIYNQSGDRTRDITFDLDTGLPKAGVNYMADKDCPTFTDWIGRYGTTFQQLAINAKIQEMADERLRKIEIDSDLKSYIMQREDTWPDYRFSYPFELKKLRETRTKMRPSDASLNRNSPTCNTPGTVSIPAATASDQALLTLNGNDADADQTVTYWIIGGNIGLHMEIEPFTGKLSLNHYYPLDPTNDPASWTLKVMVADDGYPVKYKMIDIKIQPTS